MTLTIPANDHGQIRVFALGSEVPAGDLDAAALAQMLGTDKLDIAYADLVETTALGDMTLIGYIRSGYDMDPDATDAEALRNLAGRVLLVMSRAAGGAEVVLKPAKGVRHVTTLGEKPEMRVAKKIETASAQGTAPPPEPPAKAKPSDAATGGRIATIALLVLFALVALMVWIGG